MIRRFRETDAIAFSALRNIEEVARYQSWPYPFSEQENTRFIQQMTTTHPDMVGEWFQFAIEETETGIMIGDIGTHPDAHGHLEIGFSLHPAHQGRGFMTEALTACFRYFFESRGKRCITGVVDKRNGPSQRLLERLGFEVKITQTSDYRGQSVAETVYQLDVARWRQARPMKRNTL